MVLAGNGDEEADDAKQKRDCRLRGSRASEQVRDEMRDAAFNEPQTVESEHVNEQRNDEAYKDAQNASADACI